MSRRFWIAAFGLLAVVVTMSYAAAHILSGDAEVRISARRLDDGRTEFALQQRVDGEWQERQLPDARYIPADLAHDRWLNSSALLVETEADPEAVDETPVVLVEAPEEEPIVREAGLKWYQNGRIKTQLWYQTLAGDGEQALNSRIVIRADGEFDLTETPVELEVTCWNHTGATRILFIHLPAPATDTDGGTYYTVSYRFTPAATSDGFPGAQKQRWSHLKRRVSGEQIELANTVLHTNFYLRLRATDLLEIAVSGANETVEATFSMQGVFETPIQPNIDRCGEYY